MIGKSMLSISDAQGVTTDMLFKHLESAGGLVSYVVYPLFVTAMLSALISTADSALLPLAHSIHMAWTRRFRQILNFSIIAGLLCLSALARKYDDVFSYV